MATAARDVVQVPKPPNRGRNGSGSGGGPLHRVAAVRQQQGLSLRSAARQMGIDVRKLREQETARADLLLSDLYRWQQVLGVPVVELLVDPEMELSQPVLARAKMVRLMKTVKALIENAASPRAQKLARVVEAELIQIMPELREVGSWHSVGQRRSLEEYGRAAEHLISTDAITRAARDV